MTALGMVYLGGNALTTASSFANLAGTVFALELGPNPLGTLPGALLATSQTAYNA